MRKHRFMHLQIINVYCILSFVPLILRNRGTIMSSEPNSSPTDVNLGFHIPQSWLLQAGTTSVILAVLAQGAVGQALQTIGQASEELFRGDRLPLLDFPEPESNS